MTNHSTKKWKTPTLLQNQGRRDLHQKKEKPYFSTKSRPQGPPSKSGKTLLCYKIKAAGTSLEFLNCYSNRLPQIMGAKGCQQTVIDCPKIAGALFSKLRVLKHPWHPCKRGPCRGFLLFGVMIWSYD